GPAGGGSAAARGGRVERRVPADHRVEPGEHLRLREQPGERGRDPEQRCDAAVDKRLQVLRDRALPGRRQQVRRAVHYVADVGEQRVDEQVFLVLEVVVEHTVV